MTITNKSALLINFSQTIPRSRDTFLQQIIFRSGKVDEWSKPIGIQKS
ncbi:hypothetical protein H1P_6810001 [Hyella patelloides LEGE 07179]|uniref:Uncharacterized protein n=1 Tax=Hyella patelloides LEGE 07179 TaxID=945734 RepID=A0A563W322_9CYAN|nr:hypothetical protein H1P_6810001 [Hyella patelloides LEGE 07179]